MKLNVTELQWNLDIPRYAKGWQNLLVRYTKVWSISRMFFYYWTDEYPLVVVGFFKSIKVPLSTETVRPMRLID